MRYIALLLASTCSILSADPLPWSPSRAIERAFGHIFHFPLLQIPQGTGTPFSVSPGLAATDIAAHLNALFASSTIGDVYIPCASFNISTTVTIPGGKSLIGAGNTTCATLSFTGSGTAISTTGRISLRNITITKASAQGSTGIDVAGLGGGILDNLQVTNWNTGVLLHGQTSPGDYFGSISNSSITNNVNGIDSSGNAGANTVNRVTIGPNNIFQFTNQGVHMCSGCVSWDIHDNDFEFPTGASPILLLLEGKGAKVTGGHFEHNSNTGWTSTAKGIVANGANHQVVGVNFIDADCTNCGGAGGNWTSHQYAQGTWVNNSYDNSTGTVLWDYGIAGAPTVGGACGAAFGVGNQTSGTLTGAPTGACVVSLTFVGTVATNGWNCPISDRTTGNLFRVTSTNATSVTFTGTSISGDVLSYGPCAPF